MSFISLSASSVCLDTEASGAFYNIQVFDPNFGGGLGATGTSGISVMKKNTKVMVKAVILNK